mgnify:CR=1 FL=1
MSSIYHPKKQKNKYIIINQIEQNNSKIWFAFKRVLNLSIIYKNVIIKNDNPWVSLLFVELQTFFKITKNEQFATLM